jgi:hypothetical protein
MIGSALYYRRQLRNACTVKGAHFESWLDYARDLVEFHDRGTRVAYQLAIYGVEQGLYFCEWRFWVRHQSESRFEPPRVLHTCRKATGHEGAHSPQRGSILGGVWHRGREFPPAGSFPPPRLKNCPCFLVPLMPEAAAGIKAVFDHLESTPPRPPALNTARGGLSPERLERLQAPDPKAHESPMKPRG